MTNKLNKKAYKEIRYINEYANSNKIYTAKFGKNQFPIVYREVEVADNIFIIFSTSHVWIERKLQKVQVRHNKDEWEKKRSNFVTLHRYLAFVKDNVLYVKDTYGFADDEDVDEKIEKLKKYSKEDWEEYVNEYIEYFDEKEKVNY